MTATGCPPGSTAVATSTRKRIVRDASYGYRSVRPACKGKLVGFRKKFTGRRYCACKSSSTGAMARCRHRKYSESLPMSHPAIKKDSQPARHVGCPASHVGLPGSLRLASMPRRGLHTGPYRPPSSPSGGDMPATWTAGPSMYRWLHDTWASIPGHLDRATLHLPVDRSSSGPRNAPSIGRPIAIWTAHPPSIGRPFSM